MHSSDFDLEPLLTLSERRIAGAKPPEEIRFEPEPFLPASELSKRSQIIFSPASHKRGDLSGGGTCMSLQRRTGRGIAALAAGALGVTLLAGSANIVRADGEVAPGQKSGAVRNPKIDIDLKEARLQDALQFIKEKTGISHVIISSDFKYRKVTLSLTNCSVDVTLKQIALAAGADFWQEAGIFFFGPKGSAPQAVEPVLANPEPVAVVRVGNRYDKIQLMYTSARSIAHRLLTPYYNSPGAIEAVQEKFYKELNNGSAPPAALKSNYILQDGDRTSVAPLIPTGPATRTTTRPNFSQVNPFGGDQTSHRDGQDGGSSLGNGNIERAGQFPGGGGGGFPGGGGGGFPGQGGAGFPGQGGQGQGAAGQGQGLNGTANGLLPAGIPPTSIYANEADNTIIVVLPDTPDAENLYKELRKIITYLDVKPRQIHVKADFITITSNNNNSFGINWNFQKVNLIGGASTGFSQNNTAFLQYATGNLQTALSFILTNGYGKVFASPSATTLNGVGVNFTQQNNQPYFITTPVVTNGGTTVLSTTVGFIAAQTSLNVLPVINGDGSISLTGFAISTAVGAPFTGPNGESVPNITTQQVPIQAIVRDGETMVIGGLNSKNDTVQSNKVPLLGDLPFIGNLFKSRAVATSDSELFVFVQATVLKERQNNNVIGGGALAPGGGAGPTVSPGGGL